VKTVQLLTTETPDFIGPTLLQANSSDLNPVDYRIWGKLQERVYCSRIHDIAELRLRFIEVWELISLSSMKQSDSDVHIFTLAFQHVDTMLNIDFKYRLLHLTVTCLNVANSGYFMFSGELAKLAVTFEDVDRLN